MDSVIGFLNDGNANSETFFVDDEVEADELNAHISVGGIFTFKLSLVPPFTVSSKQNRSAAISRFIKATNSRPHTSPREALVAATREYVKVSDAIDEENAEEVVVEDDTQVDDDAEIALRVRAQRETQSAMNRVEDLRAQFDIGNLRKDTVERILSDYRHVISGKHFGWSAEPRGSNLVLWDVKLFDFDPKSLLYRDMQALQSRTQQSTIDLVMKFPPEYPFKPPFIRVVRPRFIMHTGHVTIGGSICTELLTDDGWKPVFDIESIVETIRNQITADESGARIDMSRTDEYTEREAIEAFQRVAAYHKQHGW